MPIELEDIYIPLRAMLNLRGVAGDRFGDAEHAEKVLRESQAEREVSLPDAFRESEKRKQRGTVILGDPGSGKTTHLKRLLLFCLRKGSESIHLPPDMLPVFLPLRDLRDIKKGLDSFIQNQLESPHLGTKPGFGKELLERGNLLFLLDGLDEVADVKHREEVSRWIGEALILNRTCRFVVTCRYAGYDPNVELNEHFLQMHIRHFTAEQAETFIRTWYNIVETGLADDEEQAGIVAAEKADKLVTRLRETDFRARRVFELTRNPLLLTNLCLVHRHRGDLPQKRARLYLECIDVLLEHWRGAKEIRFGVDAESGRRILQPAALWLHGEEGRTRAGAGELAPVIEPALAGIKWKGGSARDFLNQVRDVSGLLTGWDLENYGFMHLGFQEFLAAAEIRRQSFDDPLVLKELASHFGESWWQEVGLLLLALQDPSVFLPYMREVVKVPAFAKNADLVEACLDDAAEVSKEPFLELVRLAPGRKKELWPRQLQAARILGQIDPKEVHALAGQLKGHPSEEIRRWIADLLRRRADDVTVADRVEYELVRIPAGRFKMGSPKRENRSFDDERPVHEVDVPAFEIGRFPVTNEQYGRFMEESPDVNAPEYWGNREFNGRRQPVVGVSWDEANRFAEWAGLRLPTEAEWEYACRAGTRTRFYTGDKDSALDRAGWFDQNSGGATHPVGEKEPNDFGLYDMHGNVWEWTDDDWHGNYEGAPKDGRACTDSPRGRYRVIRGGGWVNGAEDCRSAIRSCDAPGYRNDFLGFRLSRSLP